MIYIRQGFLAVVWFDSSPTPIPFLSRQQAFSLSRASFVSPGPGELTVDRGGGGAKSYDGKKAFPLEIIKYSLVRRL